MINHPDQMDTFVEAVLAANSLCYGGFITDEEYKAATSYAQMVSKSELLASMLSYKSRHYAQPTIVYIGSWFGWGPYLIDSYIGPQQIYCVDISRAAERAARVFLAEHPKCVVERQDATKLYPSYYQSRKATVFINTSVEHFSHEQNMVMIDVARTGGVTRFHLQSTNMEDDDHPFRAPNFDAFLAWVRQVADALKVKYPSVRSIPLLHGVTRYQASLVIGDRP